MKKSTLTFCFFLFVFELGFSQNPLVKQWDKRFGGMIHDFLWSFQETSDGGYILGGISWSGIGGDKTQNNRDTTLLSTDYWIVKIDSLGNKQWDKDFGGTAYDYLYSLQQTSDHGYILGGLSYSGIGGDKTQGNWDTSLSTTDYWIIKIDSLGNKQWDKDFGGMKNDYLFSTQQTNDGGYIIGGESFSGIGGHKTQNNWDTTLTTADYWIIKTDSQGNIQWDKDFGGTKVETFRSLRQTTDGGYILGGGSVSGISGDKTQETWAGSGDFWILKTDSAGNKVWDKDLGGIDDDWLQCLEQTSDEGYILGGFSWSGIGGDKTQSSWGELDYWIIKTDSQGNKQWDKDFGGIFMDQINALHQTKDGGYLITGGSESPASGDKTENNLGSHQTWTVKTDSLGTKQWDKTLLIYGSAGFGGDGIQTNDSCFAIAGFNDASIGAYKTQPNWDTTNATTDYWIIKFCDTTGTTGINNLQFSTSNFQIIPNPAKDFINISFTLKEEKNVRVEVYDLYGRKVFEKELQTSNTKLQTQIDLRGFPGGVYFIKLNMDGVVEMKKVIKVE